MSGELVPRWIALRNRRDGLDAISIPPASSRRRASGGPAISGIDS
jgi:hypothetical protein